MKSRKDNVRTLQRSVSELNIDVHAISEERENQRDETLQDLARKSALHKLHSQKIEELEEVESKLTIAKIDSVIAHIERIQKDIR